MDELRDMPFKRAMGHFVEYLRNGKRKPEVVAKTIMSELRNAGSPDLDMTCLINEVEANYVNIGKHSTNLARQVPVRRARFDEMKGLLSIDIEGVRSNS